MYFIWKADVLYLEKRTVRQEMSTSMNCSFVSSGIRIHLVVSKFDNEVKFQDNAEAIKLKIPSVLLRREHTSVNYHYVMHVI